MLTAGKRRVSSKGKAIHNCPSQWLTQCDSLCLFVLCPCPYDRCAILSITRAQNKIAKQPLTFCHILQRQQDQRPHPFCLHKERNDHHRQVHQDGLVYPCRARRHRKRQFNISQQLPPRAPKSRSRLFGSFGNTAHAECRKTNDRWHCKSDCCQYTRLLSCAKKRNKRNKQNKVNKSGMVCMKSRMGSAKR